MSQEPVPTSPCSTAACAPAVTSGIRNLRWWVAGLLAAAAALSYMDRQSLPIVVGEIKKGIPLSNAQYGQLTSLFLLAYAIMYAGGGRILDWLGTRLGFTVMIVWWSAANFFTGTVTSVLGLGICCFMLGMGEGGGFPGSAKAVAEWFPARERSMAFGIFNTGSSVGAVIAAPMMALIVLLLGWRWVFFITGSIGFLWAWIWFKLYQPPATSKLISAAEREYLRQSGVRTVEAETARTSASPTSDCGRRTSNSRKASPRWFQLFAYRQVWGLMAAKFFSDAAWFFFILWLPKYLGDVRHLNIKEIGYFAWIPFLFAGAGSFIGGWLSSFLIRRNLTLDRSRKIALALSMALMPVSLLIAASPLSFAIVFFSLAMFAHQFWSANMQTLPADIFPAEVVGSVGGLLGSAGSFGGMLFGLIVGRVVEHHGYGPVFLATGLLHPLSFLIILAAVRKIEPVTDRPGAFAKH
jgi:MFS transporter, ACS family, hexuronate transporter